MSTQEQPTKMKPIILLPVGAMDATNIKELRDNGICVVEAKDPSAVKLLDPIACISSRTEMENAAIQLSRRLLSGELVGPDGRPSVAELYVKILVEGTPLGSNPTQAEMEKRAYDEARIDEARKLAREDARIERAAKAQAEKAKTK